MTEEKKFKVAKVGSVQQKNGDKFDKVGNMTLGVDDKGRVKAIINIDNKVYSSFLNDQISAEDYREFAEWKKLKRK